MTISEDLPVIKDKAKRLNALADRATEQIRVLETFLRENSPGVVVVGEMLDLRERWRHPEKMISDDVDYRLGYGRDLNGDWGIVLEVVGPLVKREWDQENSRHEWVGDYGNDEVGGTMLLSRAPRHLRIAAAGKLPVLVADIRKELDLALDRAASNVKALDEAIGEIEAAVKKQK